jgi:hypothetical protein
MSKGHFSHALLAKAKNILENFCHARIERASLFLKNDLRTR